MNDIKVNRKHANAALLCIALGFSGCMTTEEKEHQQESMNALGSQLEALKLEMTVAQTALENLRVDQQNEQRYLLEALEGIGSDVAGIPEATAAVCTPPIAAPRECESQPVQTIVVRDDKIVVGELEYVWIDPPGSFVIARVDTGANSSSLHADNMVEFERDSDDWVRFELIVDGDNVALERPVTRHVRVYQQADRDGTRRPVVNMRIRLGDVQETFEFTLADRSHLDQQMLLGRNFLANTALVDVGKQFVQPQYQPQRE